MQMHHSRTVVSSANVACATDRPANEEIMKLFNRVLTHATDNVTQNSWWVQHTPLVRIDHPWCASGVRCSSLDYPAYIRCSAEAGANRAATPHNEGEWPLCARLLLSGAGAASSHPPLAYSFGIAGDFGFDDQMAALGFEVHSFDPTTSLRAKHEAHGNSSNNVHFHYAGLQAESSCQHKGANSGGSYGALGGELVPLAELRRRLGHAPSDRRLEVLKIDCEGCEWAAFWHMAMQDPDALSQLRVLLIEIHVSAPLKMSKPHDFRMFEEFFQFVFVRHGFRIAYLRGNQGGWRDRHVADDMRRLGATAGQCCYELMLVRPDSII